jgi:hypothetical protein
MAAQRDVLKVQILFAVARGSGGMRVSPQGAAWLQGRYVPWLESAKPEIGRSPLEIWEERGRGFLGKFNEIGARARAASAGGELAEEALQAAALQVEGDSDCPYCPPPKPPLGLVAPEDAVFGQTVFALASGTGALRLSAEAAGWFHDRYAPWLVTPKPGRTESPLEIWGTNGRGFLARFKAIGQGARYLTAGDEIGLDALRESARRIEAQSPCPHCPWPPLAAPEAVEPEAWTIPAAGSPQASEQAQA